MWQVHRPKWQGSGFPAVNGQPSLDPVHHPPVWPSCPALGWSSGVHKLTSMPNGNPLTTPDKTTTRCTNVAGAKCIEARPARLPPEAVTSHSCL